MNHLITEAYDNGSFKWTLTTAFGEALRQAEQLCGKRDMSFTPLGIEFINSPQPYVWYFGGNENKMIIIRLTTVAISDWHQAVYQLSHETIHCLMPKPNQDATVLEEGLATWFSRHVQIKDYIPFYESDRPEYDAACELVAQLLDLNQKVVRELRKRDISLAGLTTQRLLKATPTCPPELARQLCLPFSVYKQSFQTP